MIFNRKLLGIGALIASIFVFGGGKASDFVDSIIDSINKIQYRIKSIKDLDWVGGITDPKIKFKYNLELVNASLTNFNFNAGSTLELTKVIFKDNQNNALISSYPNVTSINLPAKGTQLIKNIPGEIPVKKLGIAFDTFQSLKPGELNLDVFVKIAGREFKINREYL